MPKKRIIHPSEFPIKFEDYGNILKHFGHEKLTLNFMKISPKTEPPKESIMEVKHSFEAI
jgi:hypothetical protein